MLYFLRSDIKIRTHTCWYGNVEKIDGFSFISKSPFSFSRQWSREIPLDYTYPLLALIQDAMENRKRAVVIEISFGIGYEKIIIWKRSLKKAEKQLFDMIRKLQEQY